MTKAQHNVDFSQPQHCLCFSMRRAARLVTRVYEEALAPGDLKVTQFGLLSRLAASHPVSFAELADFLSLDQTTLTRNLRPLERRGLVSVRPGADRRTRTIALTPKGRRLYEQVLPLWSSAQQRMVARLGPELGDVHGAIERLVEELQE